MSGVNLSIWGSSPGDSERFSDKSRGRRYSFMSLIAQRVGSIREMSPRSSPGEARGPDRAAEIEPTQRGIETEL